MSWTELHTESERLATEAQMLVLTHNHSKAIELYKRAAEIEKQAFDSLHESKVRTRGITAVSAAALWFKGGKYDLAKEFAKSKLNDSSIPGFARADLGALVDAISTVNEKRLAAALRTNEPGAMDEIYLQMHERVYAICVNILKNASDAEDACQEVFAKLYHKRSKINPPEGLIRLLSVMAWQRCMDELRKRGVRPREAIPFEPVGEEPLEQLDLPITEANQLLEADISLMRHCMESLPGDIRQIIDLYLFDFSLTEIAEADGMTKGKVRHRLDEGVKKLTACVHGKKEPL